MPSPIFSNSQNSFQYYMPNAGTTLTYYFSGDRVSLSEFLADPSVNSSKLNNTKAFLSNTTRVDADGNLLIGEECPDNYFYPGEIVRFQTNVKGNSMNFPKAFTMAAIIKGSFKPSVSGEDVLQFVDAACEEQAVADQITEKAIAELTAALAKKEKKAGIAPSIEALNLRRAQTIARVKRQMVEEKVGTSALLSRGLEHGNYSSIIQGLRAASALAGNPEDHPEVLAIDRQIANIHLNHSADLQPVKDELERLKLKLRNSRQEQAELRANAEAFTGLSFDTEESGTEEVVEE